MRENFRRKNISRKYFLGHALRLNDLPVEAAAAWPTQDSPAHRPVSQATGFAIRLENIEFLLHPKVAVPNLTIGGGGIMSILAMRFAPIFALAIAITGCASPQDKTITAFADSTKALTTTARAIGDLNSDLDYRANVQDAAKKFSETGWIDLPPAKGKFLGGKSDDKNWKAIEGFLGAISAYADALAKANDPSLVTGLTGELSGIGTAASGLAAAQGAPKASQDSIAAISGVIVDIVKIATDLYAKHQVHDAIAATQPTLERARGPLLSAISAVQSANKARAERYRSTLVAHLKLSFASMTPAQRYDLYLQMVSDFDAITAKVEALNDVARAISAMVDAHKSLLDDGDKKAAFIAFLSTVSDIVDKVNKAKAADKSNA